KYLNYFYTIYINNILVYSCIYTKYIKYFYLMLKSLQKISLYVKVKKYKFFITKT
ncbi:hypothetical protein K469DRAFT_547997, partial [Zopfia rhizophila CBS 207.26]